MTNLSMVYDTETSGVVKFKERSNDPCQPHIVQFASVLINENFEVVQTVDLIVRPEGWDIEPEALEIHGITKEYAMDVGVPEQMVAEIMWTLATENRTRIGFNVAFDERVMRTAISRHIGQPQADMFKQRGETYCCMHNARKHTNLPNNKVPSLAEAYEHFFGHGFKGAHSAIGDTQATRGIYARLRSIEPAEEF